MSICIARTAENTPGDANTMRPWRLFSVASILVLFCGLPGFAQPPASAPAHLDKVLNWRSIGPANMGGRITALAVFEADPSCYYVATASGGLLKTINNGSTFTH